MVYPEITGFDTRCRIPKIINNNGIFRLQFHKIIKLPRIAAIGTQLALLICIVTLYNAMHFKESFPLIGADRTVIVSV
jgi:hypothetical protein